jgi:hypothetical protein
MDIYNVFIWRGVFVAVLWYSKLSDASLYATYFGLTYFYLTMNVVYAPLCVPKVSFPDSLNCS